MYKMLGVDGKEYGPISPDQLRQWILEGRANGQTRVLPEGATEWKPLAEIPDLAQALPVSPTPSQPILQPVPQPLPLTSAPRTNGLAVASLVMGIISCTCGLCCYGLPFNLLGIIFSLIALSQIKSDPVSQQGRGLALAGLILSILSIFASVALALLGFAMKGTDFWRKLNM
jgi:hypothetical protein